MRLIRIVVATAIVVLVPLLTATSAHAEMSGICTAGGQVTVDGIPQTPDINPDVTDEVTIPREGVVHWHGTAGSGDRHISGKVEIELPPPIGKVTVGDWNGPSGSHDNNGTYKYNFPSLLLGLKVPVSGEHHEPNNINCSGSITVQLDGSALGNPILIASLVLTFLAAINVGIVVWARKA